MKKNVFAALAVLGIVLGIANIVTPAHASTYSFAPANVNNDG
jgi:hypothetical protein